MTNEEIKKLAKVIALEMKINDGDYYNTSPRGCFPSMEAGSVIKERRLKKIFEEKEA